MNRIPNVNLVSGFPLHSFIPFHYLDAPAVALGSRNWITPAHELEEAFFPYPDAIIDCIHEKLLPIPGYVATHNMSDVEKIDRAKKGI